MNQTTRLKRTERELLTIMRDAIIPISLGTILARTNQKGEGVERRILSLCDSGLAKMSWTNQGYQDAMIGRALAKGRKNSRPTSFLHRWFTVTALGVELLETK